MKARILNVPVADGAIPVHFYEPAETRSVPILCVHGWTLDRHSFSGQLALVERGIPLALYDRRGCGQNQLAPDLYGEADDLEAILRALPVPAVIYGVSQGARLVLRYAASGRYAGPGVVVQGGHIDGAEMDESPEEEIPFQRYIELVRNGDLDAFREQWLRHPLMTRGTTAEQRESLRRIVSRYQGYDLLAQGGPIEGDTIVRALAARSPKMLTITGELETASRKRHAALAAELTGGHTETIEGGGHLCNFTHPAAVNAVLERWLLSLTAGLNSAN